MEQILIRNLPNGTKAALRARAGRNARSMEAEVRELLVEALQTEPITIVDLIASREGLEIEFDPAPLGLKARTAEL